MDILKVLSLLKLFTSGDIFDVTVSGILADKHISELLDPTVLTALKSYPADALLRDIPSEALGVMFVSTVQRYAAAQGNPEVDMSSTDIEDANGVTYHVGGSFCKCRHCKATHYYSDDEQHPIGDGNIATICSSCRRSNVYNPNL